MKAVVFHGIGDIRVDDVPEPKIKDSTDAIVQITNSSICGTDLHMVRGTMPGMKPGTILGHEAVGIVEEVGSQVRDVKPGDRVVVLSSIACGYCSYCRSGYYAQCDNANPNGNRAGTAFFGGPMSSGAFNGLQAEKARVPYANVGLVKLPDDVSDDQAIMLSDIFPTGYFGAEMADIEPGRTVAVYGCGPVGLFAILSAKSLFGAGRVFAVDRIESRLETARDLGAEIINFDKEDPVATILELTGGIGVDRVIDCVGVDAEPPTAGPAEKKYKEFVKQYHGDVKEVAPDARPKGEHWKPGEAPSIALYWEVESLAKAGTLSIVGVYSQMVHNFPLGKSMHMNLRINMGNCHHRRYVPFLLDLVRSGAVHPEEIITNSTPFAGIIEAYKSFDTRKPGWIKIEVVPRRVPAFSR